MVNLTPHAVAIYDGDALIMTVPPAGTVARVSMETRHVGTVDNVPLYVTTPSAVVGLPEPADGVLYIVSGLVRLAVPDRLDVASPGELKRNGDGQPIGCIGLVVNRQPISP